MSEERLQAELSRVREHCATYGLAAQPAADRERRQHERFEVVAGVRREVPEFAYSVQDLSYSGLSFFSDRRFEAGAELRVSLDEVALPVEVVATQRLAPGTAPAEAQYRVHCRFPEEPDGQMFIDMLKNTRDIQLAQPE